MSISFRCDRCEAKLRVKDSFAGRSTHCPACRALVTVPQAEAVVEDEVESRPLLKRYQSPESRSAEIRSAERRPPGGPKENTGSLSPKQMAWGVFGFLIVAGFVGELARLLFVSPPAAPPAVPVARQEAPAAGSPATAAQVQRSLEAVGMSGRQPADAPPASSNPAKIPPAEIPSVATPSATTPPVNAPVNAPANPPQVADPVRTGETLPGQVARIPLPVFPNLGPGRPVGTRGVTVQTHSFSPPPGAPDTPGGRMKVRVYLPPGRPQPHSVPCVLVAPAGSTLLWGMELDSEDNHNETLPYAEAGMVVVMYELDGGIGEPEKITEDKIKAGYQAFRAAAAGVVNGRNALEFALSKIPQVDPQQVFATGHSSAGTASLLFAEHEPRLKGCIAYAPCTDLNSQLAPLLKSSAAVAAVPGLAEFIQWSSPETETDRLKCRVLVFQARDDTVSPFDQTFAFVQRVRRHNPNFAFKIVEKGGHYEPMITRGIPAAIAWIKGDTPASPDAPSQPAADDDSRIAKKDTERKKGEPKETGARRKTSEGKGPTGKEPVVLETGPAIGWTNKIANIKQIPDTEVAGMIDGVDFTLDEAILRGSRLELKKNPKFQGVFAEAEVDISLPIDRNQDVSGQRLVINGKTGFGQHIYMSAMRKEDKVPKGQFVQECLLILEFGDYNAKARTQPGRLYLCLPDRGKSYLAGTFEARVE